MLLANTKNLKLVDADQVSKTSTQEYFCPGCKAPVFLKRGLKNIAHFCHYRNSDCQAFSEGESQVHLAGKRFLYDFIKNSGFEVSIETYLPNLKQRPDLLIKTETEKIAVEFQCSLISVEKICQRTQGYMSAGYRVIWILGPTLHLNNKLLQMHLSMLNDFVITSPNLLSLDIEKQRLLIHYHFQRKGCQSEMVWQTGKLKALAFDQQPPRLKLIETQMGLKDINTQIRRLRRLHYHRAKGARNFFKALYENRDNIYHLPKEIFISCPYDWVIQTPSYQWKYYLLIWIEQMHGANGLAEINDWMMNEVSKGRIKLAHTPGVNRALHRIACKEFLKVLQNNGVISFIDQNKFKLLEKSTRYDLTL